LLGTVAAHSRKGNLNLPYDSLSQSFFWGVLQNMHTHTLDSKTTKSLFTRVFFADS
jgi:hypothetical protein